MRKQALIFCALLTLFVFVQTSEAQDKVDVFVGYSYSRAPLTTSVILVTPGTPCPIGVFCSSGLTNFGANSNGWEVTSIVKLRKWFGVAGDFGAVYGNFAGENTRIQTYLFGPQISLPGRFSPFVHLLAGAATKTISISAPPPFKFSVGTTAFALAIGGGLDWKLNRFASIRLIQVDYLLTRFSGQTRNEPRISAGLVLHF